MNGTIGQNTVIYSFVCQLTGNSDGWRWVAVCSTGFDGGAPCRNLVNVAVAAAVDRQLTTADEFVCQR